jgi:hypothetical protein
MIIVVPSNRSVSLDYLAPLIDAGARFVVVDDSPGTITVDHPSFRIYTWEDRKRMLGDADEWFPRRNGACRDFGFYVAWHESDDDEIIVALDDDCEVTSQNFFAEVTDALTARQRPVLGEGMRHLNILDLYAGTPDNLFPRGFPYECRGAYQRASVGEATNAAAPIFNLGLWTDAFDVNGIDKISGPQWRWPEVDLAIPSAAIAPGALVSVCSMNMQFRRKVTPAVYQLPMHVPVLPHWMIDRYGDIWGGFILKMLVDRAGDTLTVGAPMIGHRKAGDMQRNIWQEHIAHMVNQEAIEIFSLSAEVAPADYLTMMAEFTENVAARAGGASGMLRPYLEHLVPCLRTWCTALK